MSQTCCPRIQIVKIIQPLVGDSGPFLGRDQSGIDWAIKPELVEPKPHERYLLFSEFLMASIANQMGLSWPEAKVAIWDPSRGHRHPAASPCGGTRGSNRYFRQLNKKRVHRCR